MMNNKLNEMVTKMCVVTAIACALPFNIGLGLKGCGMLINMIASIF